MVLDFSHANFVPKRGFVQFGHCFSSILWKWEIQNISNDQKKVKITNYGNIIFIVPANFNFDPVWSYGILVKMVKILIEFKKKYWRDETKWLCFYFHDQHIKIVQKKVLPLNYQILRWPVISKWLRSFIWNQIIMTYYKVSNLKKRRCKYLLR